MCDEIDRFCRVAGKNNTVWIVTVNKLADFVTGRFIRFGCFLREAMDAAVNVGVRVAVVIANRVND